MSDIDDKDVTDITMDKIKWFKKNRTITKSWAIL